MLVFCTVFGLQTPFGVLLALLPLIVAMLILYSCEKFSDVPSLESLNNEQKTWIFLHSIDPSLSASVMAAWGEAKSWSYVEGVGSLATQSAKLAPRVVKEFCKCVAALPEHQKVKADGAVIGEFLEVCYNGNYLALADDLSRIWPAQPKSCADCASAAAVVELSQSCSNEMVADVEAPKQENGQSGAQE
ncbi:MAG: hypothetical protein ACI376_00855 [Candidatus Bruticola sp.]